MEIPVRLRDKAEVEAVFIAFEHRDATEEPNRTYPLQNRFDVTCPKVVHSRRVTTYRIGQYPTQLRAVRLVTWKVYEAMLAQPTRGLRARSG